MAESQDISAFGYISNAEEEEIRPRNTQTEQDREEEELEFIESPDVASKLGLRLNPNTNYNP